MGKIKNKINSLRQMISLRHEAYEYTVDEEEIKSIKEEIETEEQ